MDLENIIDLLKNGKIGVISTDTIYGIVGSVLNPKTVEEIYQLRKRSTNKPMIILISFIKELEKFNIKLTGKQKEFLEKNWPNPLSVTLPVKGKKFKYLHRGTNSLAFRIPKKPDLLELLKKTGPLAAPSANFEGEKVAETIEKAKKYFGNKIFYMNSGQIRSQPSTLISLDKNGNYKVLRQGAYKVL